MSKLLSAVLLMTCFVFSCAVSKSDKDHLANIERLQSEVDSLRNSISLDKSSTQDHIHTFLTFQDSNAEKAMDFYVDLFDNSKVIEVKRWGKEGPMEEGKIMHATFELNGNSFMCSDSPPIHEWGFTPAVSNFINCKDETELVRLFNALSENGKVMMPLNNYGFSKKFGFVEDQFGVSWQLNLE